MTGSNWINKPAPHPRRLPCAYCDERFATAASLMSHNNIAHREQLTDEECRRIRQLVSRETRESCTT